MTKRLRSFWIPLLFAAALAVALCVFSDALPAWAVMNAPDAMPDMTLPGLWRRAANWIAAGPPCLGHDELLRVIVPPLEAHEFGYALDAALQAVAMAALLRLFGLPAAACCGGGLALAFSGYNFTLFNAGHRGYANSMPYAVLLFALAESALRRPSWPQFALAAACAACAASSQPDVSAFVFMLVAAYAAFRAACLARAEGPRRYLARRARGFAIGAAVGAAALAAFAGSTVRHVLGDVVRQREAQISEAAARRGPAPGGGSESAAESPAGPDDEERWIFATNWSLPPEDVAEFVAPDIRGRDTGNPAAPYWGRLGRTHGWIENAPAGFPNYRQHSLYAGALVAATALFAVLCAALDKKSPHRAVVAFWCAAFAVSILLAFGRHAPFYRAFYSLPMMDKVRAPVKFVHLAEISLAALSGFGLSRIGSLAETAEPDKAARRTAKISVFAILGIGAALAVASAVQPRVPSFVPAAPAAAGWAAGLRRGALLFAAAAAAVAAAAFSRGGAKAAAAKFLVPALVVLATADLASVAARYVAVSDESPRAEPSAAAAALLASGPPDGKSWSYILLTRRPLPSSALSPIGGALDSAGFMLGDPLAGDGPGFLRAEAWTAFGPDLARRWRFWGMAGVFAPPDAARDLAQAGLADVAALLDFSPSGVPTAAKDPRRARFALLAPRGMPPSVGVWHDWKTAPDDSIHSALAEFSDSGVDPAKTIAVYAPPHSPALPDATGADPEPARWTVPPSENGGRRAVIAAEPSAPGLLFVRENRIRQFWPKISARVGGKPAPVLRANGAFLAVPVGAGPVEVEIFPSFGLSALAAPAAGWAVALAALAAWAKLERKAR